MAVDHLHGADEEHHAQQNDHAADHEDVGVGRCQALLGASQATRTHGTVSHELTEERHANGTGYGLEKVVEAKRTAGLLRLYGQSRRVNDGLVEEGGAEVVDAGRSGCS